MGIPVKMRIPPRIPNAGSITVANCEGSDVAVAEVVAFAAAEDVGVTVTLIARVMGTAVVMGIFWLPECVVYVVVIEVVT